MSISLKFIEIIYSLGKYEDHIRLIRRGRLTMFRMLRLIAYSTVGVLISVSTSYAATINDNDLFANRINLGSAANFNVVGSNVNFTREVGEPAQSGDINSAWWQWTSPGTGLVTIDTFGSDFDTFLTLATGSTIDSLSIVDQNDDAGGTLQSLITFDAIAGTSYQIAVDGFLDRTGSIALNLASPFPPAVIPVPAAVWLFGTALIGLVGVSKRRKVAYL